MNALFLLLLLALVPPVGVRIEGATEVCSFKIIPPMFGSGWREDCPREFIEVVPCPAGFEAGGYPLSRQECAEFLQVQIPCPSGDDLNDGPCFRADCVRMETVVRAAAPCSVIHFPCPVDKLPPGCPKEQIVAVPCGVGMD